jgi:hypothetical protein
VIENQSSVVERSVKIYRALLWLYPSEYREEYGWLMTQLFRDKATSAYLHDGFLGLVMCGLNTLLDLIVSVVRERQERDLTISDEPLKTFHPYLLMAGGVLLAMASISQLQPDDHYSFYGIYALSMIGLPVAIVTLIAGLYGMRTWFCKRAGVLGQLGISASVLGGTIAPILMFMLPFGEVIWGAMMLGFALLFGGVVLMGIDVLTRSTMPGWVGLLMIVTGATPFITLSLETVNVGPRYVDFAGILIAGICWVLIGAYLRRLANVNVAYGESLT